VTVPLWVWAVTLAGIAALVAVDMRQARRPHEVGFREAVAWSVVYLLAAVVFGLVVTVVAGTGPGLEFFAGYLVERSLSIDNVFVFAVVLAQFAVPTRHQHRVLLVGILGALVVRAAFIAAGAAAVERFAVTFVVFGAFLCYTAVHLVRAHGSTPEVGDIRAVRALRRVVPVESGGRDGALVTRVGGRLAATPLLAVVVTILSVDIVFALDSIPAIFGVTESAYLVLTANAFALLGLRALYFLLVGLLDRLVHLHYGLAAVLAFIGVKLVLQYVHTVAAAVPEISTGVSLAVVVAVLALTTVSSLRASPRPEGPARPAGPLPGVGPHGLHRDRGQEQPLTGEPASREAGERAPVRQ
jgi:tellurite resistance protein TerC